MRSRCQLIDARLCMRDTRSSSFRYNAYLHMSCSLCIASARSSEFLAAAARSSCFTTAGHHGKSQGNITKAILIADLNIKHHDIRSYCTSYANENNWQSVFSLSVYIIYILYISYIYYIFYISIYIFYISYIYYIFHLDSISLFLSNFALVCQTSKACNTFFLQVMQLYN